MSGTEPTRKRVAEYEKALGCVRVSESYFTHAGCTKHQERAAPLGCPVAVAAARVEAERVAEMEREVARIPRIEDGWRKTNRECIEHWNRADKAEAELASLRAVVEQVRALHTEYVGYEHSVICKECGDDMPCATLALLPEATS